MTLRDAAQQALEALEQARRNLADYGQQDNDNWPTFQLAWSAESALRAALAQPEDAPPPGFWNMTDREACSSLTKAALAQPEPRNQCAETCERAKLCAACAREIEQPEPQPVAWAEDGMLRILAETGFCHAELTTAKRPRKSPLYAAPPADKLREALTLIAAPMRPDGTWNRDREACRRLAVEALGGSNE